MTWKEKSSMVPVVWGVSSTQISRAKVREAGKRKNEPWLMVCTVNVERGNRFLDELSNNVYVSNLTELYTWRRKDDKIAVTCNWAQLSVIIFNVYKVCFMLSPKWDFFNKALTSGSRIYPCQRGGKEIVRARGVDDTKEAVSSGTARPVHIWTHRTYRTCTV